MKKYFFLLVSVFLLVGCPNLNKEYKYKGPDDPYRFSDNERYGVCTHLLDDSMAQTAVELGVKWVRLDFNWFDFQPRPGVEGFEWGSLDNFIQTARRYDLKIFATIAYAPEWASGSAQHNAPPRLDPDSNGLTLWQNAIRAVVDRYRNDVTHWGIWNEPNLNVFWSGTKAQYYNEILIPGAQIIRQIRDETGLDLKIVGPDFSHHFYDDKNSWRVSEAEPYVDIVSVHVYSDVKSTDSLSLERGDMYGFLQKRVRPDLKGKPLWVTEMGKDDKSIDRAKQASYYENPLLKEFKSQRDYIEKIFPYHLWTADNDSFSLAKPDWSPHAAFLLYQKHIRDSTPLSYLSYGN